MELAEYRRRDAQSAACNRMRGSQPHGSGKKTGANEACWSTGLASRSRSSPAAQTHDVKLLEATLDQLVMEMPGQAGQYNLCADAGYKGAPASNAAKAAKLTSFRPSEGCRNRSKAEQLRSEERRVGKESRSRWSPD